MENGQNMLQTVANTVENTMENERFELKTVAHTVEMAVSSSKMLQIAWKMVRTGNPKKIPQTKKKNPQTISYPLINPIRSMYAIYGNIYHQYTPNVSIYTIHGSYGNVSCFFSPVFYLPFHVSSISQY